MSQKTARTAAAAATITVIGGSLVIGGQPVTAENLVVTTLDGNVLTPGSLPFVVNTAATNLDAVDVITFQAGLTGIIDLTVPLKINDDVTIVGPGTADIRIRNTADDIVYVYGTGSLTMSRVTLAKAGDSAIDGSGNVELDSVNITQSTGRSISNYGVGKTVDLDDVKIGDSGDDAINVGNVALIVKNSVISGNLDDAIIGSALTSGLIENTVSTDNKGGSYLISVAGNVTIRDSTFEMNDVGLSVATGGAVDISDTSASLIAAVAGVDSGLFIKDASSVTLADVNASGNSNDGVALDDIVGAVSLTNVTANNNADDGVRVTDAGGTTTFTEVNASDNGGDGFDFDDALGLVTVTDVTANNNTGDGVNWRDMEETMTFVNVMANDNGGTGLEGQNQIVGNATLTNVTANNNGGGGVDIEGPSGDALLTGVETNGNGSAGVLLQSPGATVSVNAVVANGNSDYGVSVRDLDDAVSLTTVTAIDNGDSGVLVYSADDGLTATDITVAGNVEAGIYFYASEGSISLSGVTDTATFDGTSHVGNEQGTVVLDDVGDPSATESIITITDVTAHSPVEVTNANDKVRIERMTVSGVVGEYAVVANRSDDITISNSTITENTGGAGQPIIAASNDVALVIAHTTISGNTLDGAPLVAGALDATITLDHSIVSGNGGAPLGAAALIGSFSGSFSMVEPGTFAVVGTNVEASDPDLGLLQDNGGNNFTMLPNPGSAAIDAGDAAIIDPPATDQRGEARVVGDTIDIGAVEVDGGIVAVADVTVAEDAGTVDVAVTRTGRAEGAASVDIATAGGSATAGDDYTTSTSTVTWASGETGSKTVTIPILADTKIEADETIQLSATNPVAVTVGTIGSVTIIDTTVAPAPEPEPELSAAITSLAPQRFTDTRPNGETFDGQSAQNGKLTANGELTVQITGRGDIPDDAVGVIMNITAIGADNVGFITAHACVEPRPLASSLNYTPGVNLGNEIIAGLSTTGTICLYTSAATNLAVDVVGYITANSPLVNLAPARILDTRTNGETADNLDQADGLTTAGDTTTLKVAGRANVPTDAAAVIVNVTAVGATNTGFVTASPCVTPTPTASSLNHVAGVNRGNELVAQLNNNGEICLYTSAAINLTVDVVGYIPGGSNLTNINPARFLDTRDTTKPAANTQITLQIAGVGDVPTTATAVIANITAIAADGTGFITAHPCQNPRPLASSLNYTPGVNGGNEVVTQLNTNGELCLYTSNTPHLTVDIVGYLT